MPNVIVNNSPARILGFGGGARRGGLTFLPGQSIDVSDHHVRMLRADRTVPAYLADGTLLDPLGVLTGAMPAEAPAVAPVIEPAPPAVDAPTPEVVEAAPVGGLPRHGAVAIVEACADLTQLEAWFHAETRKAVKAAIEKRAAALLAPPSP